MLSTFKVGNPIGIFTCQIASGSEQEACNALYAASKTKIKYFYDALSDFDMVGIAPGIDDCSEDLSNMAVTMNSLRDIQLITCFPILPPVANHNFVEKLAEKPLMTITLINVSIVQEDDSDAVNAQEISSENKKESRGFQTELDIAKELSTEFSNDDHYWIMGTLGMPSLVLIQIGDDIGSLLSHLFRLSKRDIPEIHFFHTLTCVSRRQSPNNAWDRLNCGNGNVLWRIGVSFFGTQLDTVQKKILSIPALGKDLQLTTSFGKRDITVFPKEDGNPTSPKKTLNFVCEVLENIGKIAPGLIETKTILSLPVDLDSSEEDSSDEELSGEVPDRSPASRKDDHLHGWLKKAINLHEFESENNRPDITLGWKMIDTVQRYQMIYNTPGFIDLVFDMKDYLGWICDQVDNLTVHLRSIAVKGAPLTAETRKIYENMDRNIRVFNFALDQRLAGVELGIGNKVVTSVSGLGNSRTSLAIKAIGQGLFKAAGAKWNGFTILDYWPTTLCLPGGIINMSYPSVRLLGTWSKLAHETGHAYTIQNDLMNKIPFLNELKHDLECIDLGEMNVRSDVGELIEELLANLFEYFFAYGMDFAWYRDTTWTNLDRDIQPSVALGHISEHLLRTTCILLIHLQLNKLLGKTDSVDKLQREADETKNIYAHLNIYEGIKLRQWGKIGSLEKLIKAEIIRPLQSETCRWLVNDLSRVNLALIEKVYLVIDRYRNSFIDLFTQNGVADIKLLDTGRITDYQRLLRNGKICVIRQDRPNDVFALVLAIHQLEREWKKEHNASIANTVPYQTFPASYQIAVTLSLWDYYCREVTSPRDNK